MAEENATLYRGLREVYIDRTTSSYIDGKAGKLYYRGFSIDDFILHFDVPFPNHLKIDIDGIQEKVVLGARNTLRDPRLMTIMIELQPNKSQMNKNANDIILQELENAKLTCVKIAPGTPNMTNDRDQYPTNNFFKRAE